jgi:hypothetical protein
MRTKMMIPVALVFVLAACLPGQEPVDVQSQVNTAVAQAIETNQSQVDQAVALTVAAQQTLSAPPLDQSTPTEVPGLEPTSTPFDFPTPTLFVPTPEPPPTATPVRVTYKPEYACNAINRRPKDNTEFNRNAKFDIRWIIVNTGTKTWPKGIDVKYFSGPQMSTVNRIEIPKEMKPGDTFVVDLDAVAPDKRGFYVMTWTLDGQMCYPYVAINVK